MSSDNLKVAAFCFQVAELPLVVNWRKKIPCILTVSCATSNSDRPLPLDGRSQGKKNGLKGRQKWGTGQKIIIQVWTHSFCTYCAVATETMGTWGKVGLKFLKDLGKRIIEATGEKRSTCFLFQALSMANQMGDVASIKGSIPDSKTMDEVFYL